MGRVTKEVELNRRAKLTRLHCDMLEGIYPWPDGKVRPPGEVNKSELLRAADYSAKYKNGYAIFNRLDYRKGVQQEMEKRRSLRLKEELPDSEQLEKMRKLCNMELLDRLENRPHTISDRDLVGIRNALEKLMPAGDGDEPGKGKGKFNINIDKLVIDLEKLIPKASLEGVKQRVGIVEECIEGECVEDDVPQS